MSEESGTLWVLLYGCDRSQTGDFAAATQVQLPLREVLIEVIEMGQFKRDRRDPGSKSLVVGGCCFSKLQHCYKLSRIIAFV
ncbi:unnamed protein product [Strongylus vulgaris]|uniref:Uncharacterized protein n=1 Tax=Strongylus vulgaris TaxID=40348 RepID=A0A3P7KES3_STRVU|nr:unnamed protein product [Strongylus vulgaris]